MNSNAYHLFGAAVATLLCLTSVTSSPVLPGARVNRMDNPDACLFVCNICFNDNEEKMVTCANNYCLSPDMYTGLPYLLIGKRCEHWENLNKYVLSELKH